MGKKKKKDKFTEQKEGIFADTKIKAETGWLPKKLEKAGQTAVCTNSLLFAPKPLNSFLEYYKLLQKY